MNIVEVIAQLDAERRTLRRDGETQEMLADVTRLTSSDGSQHDIIYSALTAETADAVIAREVAHYRQLGATVEWKVYRHDPPADLLDRLAKQGFAIGPKEAVLVLDLTHPPAWVFEFDPSAVVRIDRLDQLPLFRRAAEAVFKKDWSFTTNQLADEIRAGSANHRGYVAMHDGEPVSVGRLYLHRDSAFGGLYGGGTIEGHRHRGFYRSLIAARARDAIAGGAKYLIVDALPTSRPILERLGFVHITDTWPAELDVPKSH